MGVSLLAVSYRVTNVMEDDFRCEIVSYFLLNTCVRQLNSDNITALHLCAKLQAAHQPDDNSHLFVSIACIAGSHSAYT